MADPLNTLGFVSWGLLGEGEGGVAEKVYVLDMEVAVEADDKVVGVEVQELQSIAIGLDESGVLVDIANEVDIALELEDEEVSGEAGDLEVGTEVCE